MKDATSIAIVFIVCLLLLLLHFFVIQGMFSRNNDHMAAQLEELRTQESNILWMGSQISAFEQRLPDLKKRINYYKQAIPADIDDHIFFDYLISELRSNNVELLEIQQSGNRPWLGTLPQSEIERFTEAGLDVNAIQRIRKTTFKVKVFGEFNDVLTAVENLKKLGRLYTVDQIISPAGRSGGTVLVNNLPTLAQMEITGSLFYGIPEHYRDAEGLDKKYLEVAVVKHAREVSLDLKGSGKRLVSEEESIEDLSSEESQDGQGTADEMQEGNETSADSTLDGSVQSGIPAVAGYKDRG